MKALLLQAGNLRPTEIDIEYKPDDCVAWLRTMQNAIGATTIEYVIPVRLNKDLDKKYFLIIDDNGLLKENPVPNYLAYVCYDQREPLYGDALLVTDAIVNDIGERDFVPIPEEELDDLKAQLMGYGDILMLMGVKGE